MLPPNPSWFDTWMINGRSFRSTSPPLVETAVPLSSMMLISVSWAVRLAFFQSSRKREVASTFWAPVVARERKPVEAGPESCLKFFGSAFWSSALTSTLA